MDYPHLWSRVYGAPLAIHPEKAAIIESVFREKFVTGSLGTPVAAADPRIVRPHVEDAAAIKYRQDVSKPYALTQSGIAVIPVLGTLVQRASGLDAMSGMMSYGMIGSRVSSAADDSDVAGILLEVDSYGGEAFGLSELADQLAAAGKKKPLWASVNEQAYSAAYFIAAAAARIYIPLSGCTGSIGTIALHVDQSKRDARDGYVYTYVYAGSHKKDFNAHEPLSEPARHVLQSEVDRHYALFVEHVAAHRDLSGKAVRATEAGLLPPDAALQGGFVDGIATFAETVGLLETFIRSNQFSTTGARLSASRPSTDEKETQMSKEKLSADKPDASVEQQPKHTDAQLSAAVEEARIAAKADGVTEGTAAGTAAGIKSERERVKGILTHAEAKERPQAALSCALDSDMTIEQAGKFLALQPKGGNAFLKSMGEVPNPRVGADAGGASGEQEPRLDAGAIFASRRAAVTQAQK